ncbi:hypothetical protein ABZP36_017945 [Zizania latifolia]
MTLPDAPQHMAIAYDVRLTGTTHATTHILAQWRQHTDMNDKADVEEEHVWYANGMSRALNFGVGAAMWELRCQGRGGDGVGRWMRGAGAVASASMREQQRGSCAANALARVKIFSLCSSFSLPHRHPCSTPVWPTGSLNSTPTRSRKASLPSPMAQGTTPSTSS